MKSLVKRRGAWSVQESGGINLTFDSKECKQEKKRKKVHRSNKVIVKALDFKTLESNQKTSGSYGWGYYRSNNMDKLVIDIESVNAEGVREGKGLVLDSREFSGPEEWKLFDRPQLKRSLFCPSKITIVSYAGFYTIMEIRNEDDLTTHKFVCTQNFYDSLVNKETGTTRYPVYALIKDNVSNLGTIQLVPCINEKELLEQASIEPLLRSNSYAITIFSLMRQVFKESTELPMLPEYIRNTSKDIFQGGKLNRARKFSKVIGENGLGIVNVEEFIRGFPQDLLFDYKDMNVCSTERMALVDGIAFYEKIALVLDYKILGFSKLLECFLEEKHSETNRKNSRPIIDVIVSPMMEDLKKFMESKTALIGDSVLFLEDPDLLGTIDYLLNDPRGKKRLLVTTKETFPIISRICRGKFRNLFIVENLEPTGYISYEGEYRFYPENDAKTFDITTVNRNVFEEGSFDCRNFWMIGVYGEKREYFRRAIYPIAHKLVCDLWGLDHNTSKLWRNPLFESFLRDCVICPSYMLKIDKYKTYRGACTSSLCLKCCSGSENQLAFDRGCIFSEPSENSNWICLKADTEELVHCIWSNYGDKCERHAKVKAPQIIPPQFGEMRDILERAVNYRFATSNHTGEMVLLFRIPNDTLINTGQPTIIDRNQGLLLPSSSSNNDASTSSSDSDGESDDSSELEESLSLNSSDQDDHQNEEDIVNIDDVSFRNVTVHNSERSINQNVDSSSVINGYSEERTGAVSMIRVEIMGYVPEEPPENENTDEQPEVHCDFRTVNYLSKKTQTISGFISFEEASNRLLEYHSKEKKELLDFQEKSTRYCLLVLHIITTILTAYETRYKLDLDQLISLDQITEETKKKETSRIDLFKASLIEGYRKNKYKETIGVSLSRGFKRIVSTYSEWLIPDLRDKKFTPPQNCYQTWKILYEILFYQNVNLDFAIASLYSISSSLQDGTITSNGILPNKLVKMARSRMTFQRCMEDMRKEITLRVERTYRMIEFIKTNLLNYQTRERQKISKEISKEISLDYPNLTTPLIDDNDDSVPKIGDCGICMSEKNDKMTLLPCGHILCNDCIYSIRPLKGPVSHKECPFCKEEFSKEQVIYSTGARQGTELLDAIISEHYQSKINCQSYQSVAILCPSPQFEQYLTNYFSCSALFSFYSGNTRLLHDFNGLVNFCADMIHKTAKLIVVNPTYSSAMDILSSEYQKLYWESNIDVTYIHCNPHYE